MQKSGELNHLQFEHLIEHLETETPNKLNLVEFEDLLDEIIMLCGGEIEDAYESDFEGIEKNTNSQSSSSKGFKR